MESTLFTELSENQQELVAGGGQLTDLYDELYSRFQRENSIVMFEAEQVSGPNGSTTTQAFMQDFEYIFTDAYKDFYAEFDGVPEVPSAP